MILFKINSVDVTDKIERDSFSMSEQLQNRTNTCNFSIYNYKVIENQEVEIWKGATTIQQSNSGTNVIYLDDTHEYFQRFLPNQEIFIDIEGIQKSYIIDTIDYNNNTITLTTNLESNLLTNKKVGVKVFAGNVINAPETEITNGVGLPVIYQEVQCSDYNYLLDRKNVVDTFINMYPKEIISRTINKFIASESELTIDTFSLPWNESGQALPMVDDLNVENVIEGLKSQKASLNTGTGLYEKTITAINLTTYDRIRMFYKVGETQGIAVAHIKYRFGNDSSNYYSYTMTHATGLDDEDCYHLEAVKITEPTEKVGTVNLASITYLAIEIQAVNPVSAIYFDVIKAVKKGFSCNNFIRGGTKLEEARFQYQKPSVVINRISKLYDYYWHIDFDRDVNMYVIDKTPAVFNLSDTIGDTTYNYSDLSIEADVSSLKNMQTVRGGEAPDETEYTQEEYGDGAKTSWYLDYKPKDIRVFTDTGSGYIEKTVGIENIANETTVDYVFNFSEKTLRKAMDSTLTSSDKIKISYYPYKAIRVRLKDEPSINAMKLITGGDGIYEGAVITDTNIKTWDEARKRCQAELNTYKNPIVTIQFTTEQENLHAGNIIRITDTDRGIDDEYLIQRIGVKQKAWGHFIYNVQAGTTLFGLIEFFQLLLNSRTRAGDVIDKAEVVDVVENVDETITIQESYTFTQKTSPFTIASRENKNIEFNNIFDQDNRHTTLSTPFIVPVARTGNGWVIYRSLYAFFNSAVGTVTAGQYGYTDNYQIKIEKTSGTQINVWSYLFDLKSSTQYTMSFWYKNESNAGNASNLIRIKEYEFSPVQYIETQTTTVKTITTENQDDYVYFTTTFTTHANTEKARLYLENTNKCILYIADIRINATVEVETQPNPAIVDYFEV